VFILFILIYVAFVIYSCGLVFDPSFVEGFPSNLGSFLFSLLVIGA
jgi:hypothetical protein